MSDEFAKLRHEVELLTRRVTALEDATRQDPVDSENRQSTASATADAFWALSQLRSRLSDDPSTADGAVMLVGAVTLPTGASAEWQQAAGTAGMFDVEWSDRAGALAALGHSMRVELLRHVLCGTQTTAALAELESLGTTGQLHHHLRQLLAAGWLRQTGRGSYEVPATRVVPLLACLTAAER